MLACHSIWHSDVKKDLSTSAPLSCDLSQLSSRQILGPMQQSGPGIAASASYSYAQQKICSADSSLSPSVRYRSASVKREHQSPGSALPPRRRQVPLAPLGGITRSTAPRAHALAVPFPALEPCAPGCASWMPARVGLARTRHWRSFS